MKRFPVLLSPRRRSVRLAVAGTALAVIAGSLGPAASAQNGEGEQAVTQFLASTGEDKDATARAHWSDDGAGKTTFSVELENMDEGTYDLYVTDTVTPKGSITVDDTGAGEIEFVSPLEDPKPLFDFAVFGQEVQVREGDTAFFLDTFTDEGSGNLGNGDKTKTSVVLVNVGMAIDFDAHGTMKYLAASSEIGLVLTVENLDAGAYTLLVGGTPVADVTTVGELKTEIVFHDPIEPGNTLLNFDPLGQQVDLALGDDVILSGVLPGSNTETGIKAPSSPKKAAKDLGKTKEDSLQVALLNTGGFGGAKGSATLTQGTDTVLVVSVADLPATTYGLLVDGADVGTLTVDATSTGQLEFSTNPTGTQTLLDFEVKGQLIQVMSETGVILHVVFPNSVQEALASYKKESSKNNKVKVNLINGGVDLDARGTVSWKIKGNGDQQVTVDARDLAPGTYNVVVNSVTTAIPLTVTEKGKGKLTYATVPTGSKVALDFDPVDATLQITDSSDVVLLQSTIDVP